ETGAAAGLVGAVSAERFEPDREITREQMAVIIANAMTIAGRSGIAVSKADDLLNKFGDQADISEWARAAVARAVEAGIIRGVTADTIAPATYATRAQAAVLLKRFLQFIEFIDK